MKSRYISKRTGKTSYRYTVYISDDIVQRLLKFAEQHDSRMSINKTIASILQLLV
ncbi:hypothetical protein GSUET_07450 [Geobacter sulfurreducens subsp. ethanolicus]|jgi:hypothetical protein|nr:hypothetical protein GSUET_07450 [Geobacter sulfurreducens subsp. ethanolicus]